MRKALQIRIQSSGSLLLLFAICLWACGLHSALAQEIAFRWSTEGLVGQATQVSLGEVLKELNAHSDIEIYIDPKLVDTSVTFSFPQPTETETALKRLLGPHNTAFVYTKDRVTNAFRILQVKIFAAGKSDQGGLLHLTAASPVSASSVVRGTDAYAATHAAGLGQGSHSYGRAVVRPYYQSIPGAFGSTLPSRREGAHGPDYRLNATERRQVYEEIQQNKADLAHRTQRARQIDARTACESGKSTYRSQRNDALQAYLNR